MPVKPKEIEQAEHGWIREYLPEDHAALFMQGGPLDELLWLYQVDMGGSYYHLIEGGIRREGVPVAGLRDHYLDTFKRIMEILEEARVILYDHPELNLTGQAHYRISTGGQPLFPDLQARVTIRLFSR